MPMVRVSNGGTISEVLAKYVNKEMSIATSSSVYLYFPFTTDTVSNVVIDVGYWINYTDVYANGTKFYSGRRKETTSVFDITQYLTSDLLELRISGGSTNNDGGKTKFTSITTK